MTHPPCRTFVRTSVRTPVSHLDRYHMGYTGCGNSLNTRSQRVLQLIIDSLRYWTTEMHPHENPVLAART